MKKHQVVVRRSAPSRGSSSSSSSSSTSSSLTSTKNVSSRYGQCQKNHLASTGGYAVDGCREFMARGEEAGMSLTCAACGCHRNFHRREVDTQVVFEFPPPS